MRLRYLLPLGAFLGLVALLAVGLTLNPREVPSPLVDRPAPTFRLPQLADASATVTGEDLRGRVTLLNVWASWCVSCRQEHPLLVELSRRTDLEIIGLNYRDTRSDALRWLERFGDPYGVSAFDADGRVGIDYGVYGVPETYVIDTAGVIRHKHTGPLTERVLQDEILPLVSRLSEEAGPT